MGGTDTLSQFQDWYASQCNGEWEHSFGVSIVTLDNPAWNVRVALTGTTAQGTQIPTFRSPNYLEEDTDWVECRLSDDGGEFWGVGDQHKLAFILEYFLRHVPSSSLSGLSQLSEADSQFFF
jgi:hypothetical protein